MLWYKFQLKLTHRITLSAIMIFRFRVELLVNTLKSFTIHRNICAFGAQAVVQSHSQLGKGYFNYNFFPSGEYCKVGWKISNKNLHVPKLLNSQNFTTESQIEEINSAVYERICQETLDSLCEYFEDIVEKYPVFKTADVAFGDGVLTVNLEKFGTYVINRQSPNKQIWLSSPTSGPKRYNFVPSKNSWVYRHDNCTLHSLLQSELSTIIKAPVDLTGCAYSGNCQAHC